MKPFHTFRFKMLTAMAVLLSFCFSVSAHTEAVDETQKGMSPFEAISTLLQQQGIDNVNLLTVVPSETFNLISPQLKKALKVKDDVGYEPNSTVGDVLTSMLKKKYGKKSNEKNDFLSIQYSTSSSDFEKYLIKYPNSKFANEARARLNCFNENELLLFAKEENTRLAYETFANLCANNAVCDYEGCEGIGAKNHKVAEAVSKWYALTDRSTGSNPSLFSEYISQFGDDSPFALEAADSLEVNQDRYDWKVATSKDTKAAYESYLASHEDGINKKTAELALKELTLWEKAKDSDKYEDFCAYYEEYPEGKHADETIKKLKQIEDAAWQQAQKKNTLAAYEDFVNKYPSGYYSSDAQNKISDFRLAPFLKEPASLSDLTYFGGYSQPGYSLIFLGNGDKKATITVSLNGPTGYSKKFKPGAYEWVKVKNGKYRVLVQASNVENYWGNCTFEDRIYGGAWCTTVRNSFGIQVSSNINPEYSNKFEKVIDERVIQELINALGK
ncbi:MAG: hypothetical protein IKH88_17730 [Prevotella sp.]|nr:hypothetical protein [Prevotella sp.]